MKIPVQGFNSDSWKKIVLNAAEVWGGAVIPLPKASPGQVHAGGPGKIDLYCSKGHRLAYLFIFYVKFSAVWGIFV